MAETNPNSRLEAFCDGVFAIALTLLIIDIKIPSTTEIHTNAEFWLALKNMLPSIFAFILSFVIILISWVNHHASLKLGNKSSTAFYYANGFLLLTIVFLPFPTSLMGEYILTDHAAPSVVLYNATLALQSVGWILIANSALRDKLYINDAAAVKTRISRKYGYYALLLYAGFALLAFWFPQTIACITILTWLFWLLWGINIKED